MDPNFATRANTPVNQDNLQQIMDFNFPDGNPPERGVLPWEVWLCLDHAEQEIHTEIGSLKSLIAEERLCAPWVAFNDFLHKGKDHYGNSNYNNLLQKWYRLFWCVCVHAEVCSDPLSRWIKAQNLREEVEEAADAIERSLEDKVNDVYGLKVWQEHVQGVKLSNEKLFKLLTKVKQAKRAEDKYSQDMIKCCISVKEKVFSNDRSLKAVKHFAKMKKSRP